MRAVLKFYHDEQGVTAVEYALIAALVAVVMAAGVAVLNAKVNDLYGKVASNIK